jgi:hypothetical protein
MSIKDRANTLGQKRAIIERLYAAWCATDDIRLGQLILNSIPETQCYYIEDEPFIEAIESLVTRINEAN